MAKVNISLDVEPMVEVMVLAGVGSPQDAVEAVVRDYIARGHRTEVHTELKDQSLREAEAKPQEPRRPGLPELPQCVRLSPGIPQRSDPHPLHVLHSQIPNQSPERDC